MTKLFNTRIVNVKPKLNVVPLNPNVPSRTHSKFEKFTHRAKQEGEIVEWAVYARYQDGAYWSNWESNASINNVELSHKLKDIFNR